MPDNPPEESSLFPVEHTPEVDERLKSMGLGPTEEEIKAEEEKKKQEEAAKATEEAKQKEEEQKKAEQVRLEEEAKKKEKVPEEEEISLTDEEAQKIIEEKTGKKKTEQYPWEKEGREPTEREVLEYVSERSAQIVEERQAEADRQQKEKETAEQKQKDDYRSAWEKEWGRQIEVLESNGYLPKVGDKTNEKDPGVIARHQLWEEAVKHNSMNLIEVYLLHVAPNRGKQPAGSTAPISRPSAANPNPSGTQEEEYSYEDIHGKNPADFASNVTLK